MESGKRGHRLVSVIVSVLILGGVFFAGYTQGQKTVPDIKYVQGLSNLEIDKPADIDFAPFWKVWRTIDERFVFPKSTTTALASTQERVYGAIMGLTGSLGDPYTLYFPPEENKMFQDEMSGTFEGVGMEIGIKEGLLTVVAPLKDTPADRAGVQSGDKILTIDDLSTAGMGSDEAVRRIRGKKGTTVTLLIKRPGKSEPFEINIVRDTINIPTIRTDFKTSAGTNTDPSDPNGLRSDGVFVVKLYSFTAQSPDLFRNALRQFIESGSDKLVLDLRANPGGYLEAAVDMASWFLPAGKVVVSETYAKNEDDRVYRSHGYDVFNKNLKMVILIDGGSASASEILAGALHEYGIAKTVGTKSFGKGSVQELVPITGDTSLKLTIARWVTPKGISISEGGLTPDHLVDRTADDIEAERDPQLDKAIEVLKNWGRE